MTVRPISTLLIIGTSGNEAWATGEWSQTVKGQNWGPLDEKGYYTCIFVREGDVWKVRVNTWNRLKVYPPHRLRLLRRNRRVKPVLMKARILQEARAGGFVVSLARIFSAARATSKRRNGSLVARGSIPGAFRTQACNRVDVLCGRERPGEGCHCATDDWQHQQLILQDMGSIRQNRAGAA